MTDSRPRKHITPSFDKAWFAMQEIKRNSMRALASALICLFVVNVSIAAENPLKALWPFGKNKQPAPMFSNPFTAPQKKTNDSFMGLPSPTQWIDKAEKQTNAVFKKTRENWQGAQNFGKSLNPFGQQKQKKKSWLDVLLPKEPVNSGPATMGEFLNMKRPGY